MSKIACLCGHTFSNVGSPSDVMHVVRDGDMEMHGRHTWQTYELSDVERSGMLPEKGTVESEQFHASLHSALALQGELWECPECGRLLFRRPGETTLRVFAPSSTTPLLDE